MKTKTKRFGRLGQAAVTMLVFSIVSITICSTATLLVASNTLNASMFQVGLTTYQMAEAGAENAVVNLLRNPSYTGETLNIDGGSVAITVVGTNPKTITSSALYNNHQRVIQLIVSDIGGMLTVTSWMEIF